MKYFIKRYSLLLIVQTACLALGLWLEQRFVVSATPKESQQNVSVFASGNAKTAGPRAAAGQPAFRNGKAEIRVTAVHVLAFLWIAGLQIVVAYLILMRDHEEVSRQHNKAESVSLRQYNELVRTRDAVIFGLARLTESRDLETGNHLERISVYSTRLATAARQDPRFCTQISPAFIKLIGISSVLHDIGKVGVRDSILLKPGKLERHERPLMQLHSAIGGKCIREIESRLGKSNFLAMAREIAFNHHERWDGLGYPKGLAGDEIPLSARIVSIADVYDALSTRRVYRDALPHEKCVEMIRCEAGRQFDPALVEIFLKLEAEFRQIGQQCRDGSQAEKAAPPPPPAETPIIAAESESALDEKFVTLQAALGLCADNSGETASAAEQANCPLAKAADTSAASSSTFPARQFPSESEKEPSYVA